MHILEIINKKKSHIPLTEEEINFIVSAAIDKTIPDYQLSALLMTFRLNGMTDDEIYFLTKAFIDTSAIFNFKKHHDKLVIDKHSSGGVGDKVSLIIIPILHALGFEVAKISGKGLGHTGGTVDKLDAIGFNSDVDMNEAQSIFDKCGMVLMQQTPNLVPADKIFYGLRDVTGTVDTLGLIVSSILSKKFVLNSDYIFIDLKVGSGAIFQKYEDALALAQQMIKVATRMERKLFIHITNMDIPLGNAIGNKIEVKESYEFLLNKNVNPSLKTLVETFVIDILLTTNKATSHQEAKEMYNNVINNGSAYNSLLLWLQCQGADISKINTISFFQPQYQVDIYATDSGYLNITSAADIGNLAIALGAGRYQKEDVIDPDAGIYWHELIYEKVTKGQKIATLYSSQPIQEQIISKFASLLKYEKNTIKNGKMILSILNN